MKPKILVLDDETNLNIFKDALDKSGYEIDHTPSEIWALDKIAKGSFMIFFITLKQVGGLEVIKRALEIDPKLCIIAMADSPTMEMVVETMKVGACDFLVKPIDRGRLRLIVDKAIKGSNLHYPEEEKPYQQLAIIDGLTEIYNHRYFHEMLSREIERVRRYPQKVSLLLADVDNFKEYNDTHGHQAGDMALKAVAQGIAQQVRQVDLVARYGGEEFGIVLPNADKQRAHTLASRIRSSIAQIGIEGEGAFPTGQLTISIGLATYPDEAKTKDELIARADKALYKAKANGRNRVFAFW